MPAYMTVLEIANWVSGLAAVGLMIVARNQAMPEEKQPYNLAARVVGGICLCGISAYGMLFDSRSAIATVQGRVTDLYEMGDDSGPLLEFNVESAEGKSDILKVRNMAFNGHYVPVLASGDVVRVSYNTWSAEAESIRVLEGKQAGWTKTAEARKRSPGPLELLTGLTGAILILAGIFSFIAGRTAHVNG
jgi:hypothetical protein